MTEDIIDINLHTSIMFENPVGNNFLEGALIKLENEAEEKLGMGFTSDWKFRKVKEDEQSTDKKLVLPGFVADWYERYYREDTTKLDILKALIKNTDPYSKTQKVFEWAEENEEIFLLAITTGEYQVEQKIGWLLKLGNLYFIEGGEIHDNFSVRLTENKKMAFAFHGKKEIDALQESIGGKIEAVELNR